MYHHSALAAAVGILALASLCCVCGSSLGCVALHAALSRALSAESSGDRGGGGGWALGWGVPLPPAWVDGAVDALMPPLPPPAAPTEGGQSTGAGEWPLGRSVRPLAGYARGGGSGRWLDDGDAPARMAPYVPGQWSAGSGRGDAAEAAAAAGREAGLMGGLGLAAPLSMRSQRRPPREGGEAAAECSGPAGVAREAAEAGAGEGSEDGTAETARTGSEVSGSEEARPEKAPTSSA